MKIILCTGLVLLAGCSHTDHYLSNRGNLHTCSSSWNNGIAQIQANAAIKDCKKTQLARGFVPVDIETGHLGIFPDDEYVKGKGFKIDIVMDQYPASVAGIFAGDYIYKINGSIADDFDNVLDAIGGNNDKSVILDIMSGGVTQKYTLQKKKITKYVMY